jgi:penicillin-binding protein 2
MAYRVRRRQRRPWVVYLLVVVALGVGAFLGRHSLEAQAARLGGPLGTALAPKATPAASGAVVAIEATATFTVGVDQAAPLANVPPPELAAAKYLAAWGSGQYATMYAMLAATSQSSQTQDAFVQRYQDLTSEATITSVAARVTSVPYVPDQAGNGASVQVPFTVDFQTIRVGSFSENNSVTLVLENGQWKVDWRPSLFFKDLAPGDLVRLFPLNPQRGSILDRQGRPLATMGFQEQIGVVPNDLQAGGQVDPTLQAIGAYLKKSPDDLKKKYANQPPAWYIPLGDVPGNLENELTQKFKNSPGVVLKRDPIRVYPQGDLAAHIVGYVGHITTDELKTLSAQGYTIDDIVGRAGVEASAEQYLAGVRGGKLAVVAPTGEVIKVIAERDAVPGSDVVLSIDIDVQRAAEQVLGKLDGSIVVMNPQDNSLLAMASYPRFDPNKFVTGFTTQELQALENSPDSPFLDRPAEAVYPTGSIFKVITMSAGMEVLGYKPSDTFDCNYWWHGPAGLTLHNWTVQGTLNLIQSLTGSCDPTFYTIGLALDRKSPTILPQFARAFGLGQKTGVNGINEVAGTVPDPNWKQQTYDQPWFTGDSVNLSIGQGYLQATPLQMANAYSAIANDGLRRTPILIQKVLDQRGNVVKTFAAEKIAQLPDSPSTIQAIHEGMLGVTSSPIGTAYYAFNTYHHPMEAKTGSAENQNVLAHAWFVGYSPPTNPNLLILVMVEGRGESMQIASPMARQLMDLLLPDPATPTPAPRPTTATAPSATPTPAAAGAATATATPHSGTPAATPTTAPKPARPTATPTPHH